MNTQVACIDFECRSKLSVKEVGAYLYATHPSTRILSMSVRFPGDEPVSIAHPEFGGQRSPWDQLKRKLRDWLKKGNKLIAHNAGFDRNIYRYVFDKNVFQRSDLTDTEWVRSWLCSAVLARRASYPSELAGIANALGVTAKDDKGKFYIKMLSDANKPLPENWRELMTGMVDYGLTDVVVLSEIVEKLLPYSWGEWGAWWASEIINDRGLPIDRRLCQAASEMSGYITDEINTKLREITGMGPTYGPKGGRKSKGMTLGNHPAKAEWLRSQLEPYPELLQHIVAPGKDKEGNPKYTADEFARNSLMEALEGEAGEALPTAIYDPVVQFLEALTEGQGAAAAKFKAMLERCSDDGRLRGAYWHDGAGATGRWSSKGAQVHNMVNKTVPNLEKIIETVSAETLVGAKASKIRKLSDLGLATTLGRCVRPAICAPEGRWLVWGDFSGVEARGLPWLSDSPGGRRRLELFDKGHDFYCDIASKIFNRPITRADKYERSVGKGVELGSGYGGSAGAIRNTLRKYEITGIDNDTLKEWVQVWRDDNPDIVNFWYDIKRSVEGVLASPGQVFRSGLLSYRFVSGLLGGSLVCKLPSGRYLVYAHFETSWEDHEEYGRRKVFTCRRFRKGMMRKTYLWHGTFVENATQAACNDLLRSALVRALDAGLDVIGHTHDEIIVECDENEVGETRERLAEVMAQRPEWAADFPLASDFEDGKRYEKKD